MRASRVAAQVTAGQERLHQVADQRRVLVEHGELAARSRAGVDEVNASVSASRISRSTCSSQAARSASFEPKWWMTSAGLTPASTAMARTGAPNPVGAEPADRGVADARPGGESSTGGD